MPFKSKAQQRKFFAMEAEGKLPKGTALEWAHKTPNLKGLPEHVKKSGLLAHAHESAAGIAKSQLREGEKVEMEHTTHPAVAKQIAIDHLHELPDYYTKLRKMEKGANGDMLQYFADHPDKLREKRERDKKAGVVAAVAAELERRGWGGSAADDVGEDVKKRLKISNYKLEGERMFRGLDCAIENKKGSTRYWHDPHGKEKGSTHMYFDYGYVRGSKGTDGDHVDVYIGPDEDAENVYLIDQMKKPDFKEFDEQKCMLGFKTEADAKAAYLRQYNDPKFFGGIKTMKFDEFKDKVLDKENHGSKLAVSAGWIRERAVNGLAKRNIALDGKQQSQIARKAVDYARAKEVAPAGADAARGQLTDVLDKFKKMSPNVGRRSAGPRAGGYSAGQAPDVDLGFTPEGHQHFRDVGRTLARVPPVELAYLPAAVTGIQRAGEQQGLMNDLSHAQEGKTVKDRPESPTWRAADAATQTLGMGYPGALAGGIGGAVADAFRHSSAPKSKFSPALTAAGVVGGGMLGGALGHHIHTKREKKIEGLRGQIADAQQKAASSDRTSRIADRLDDAGIATLASPIIADAAEHGLKHLMLRGGRLGALAAEGHTLAQGASSFLHAHPHAVEGAGLALVAPGVTHTLAGGINKVAPKPVMPAPQEPVTAGVADQQIFKRAAEEAGRMLAREKTSGLVSSLFGSKKMSPGEQMHWDDVTKNPQDYFESVSGEIHHHTLSEELGPGKKLTAQRAKELANKAHARFGAEKVAINVANVAGAVGRTAWRNRGALAGIGAVGAVAGGLYGAKKTVDAATNMATTEREPARYSGVTPGMRPPAPVTMI